jgi:magnesium chelatase family protein
VVSRVWSSTTVGIDALPVQVETHIDSGLPRYTVVGLPDGAIRESRDRVWAAIKNSGMEAPRGAITINLAPADIRKEGAAFDLPIALGLLAATMTSVRPRMLDVTAVVGELALDGSVRRVTGVLPMVLRARDDGLLCAIVPRRNSAEAAEVDGITVFAVDHLRQALSVLTGRGNLPGPAVRVRRRVEHVISGHELDMSDVRGQPGARRALEVAAAGGHNLLLVGPPGAGKTMLARRLPTILPPMSRSESLETSRVHSVGSGNVLEGLIRVRPFRAPHHTISDVGLCGGGANPRPGEISLAHNGVLFLDELPEFKRGALEVLRQPVEEGRIVISRARVSVSYPARFMLVASMNPCPCGYINHPSRPCACSPASVQRYLGRVSGPLMDRIDLHVEVGGVAVSDLWPTGPGESSKYIRHRVVEARNLQHRRFRHLTNVFCNAHMSPRQIKEACRLDRAARHLLDVAVERLGLSARAHDRVLRVARTIADLSDDERVTEVHIAEAVQYRSLDRRSWPQG